jgi:hypothetical protein
VRGAPAETADAKTHAIPSTCSRVKWEIPDMSRRRSQSDIIPSLTDLIALSDAEARGLVRLEIDKHGKRHWIATKHFEIRNGKIVEETDFKP